MEVLLYGSCFEIIEFSLSPITFDEYYFKGSWVAQ